MARQALGARTLVFALALIALLGGLLVAPPVVDVARAADAPGSITLHVQTARAVAATPEGSPISAYQWLINAEDTGNPQDSTANCLPNGTNDATFADTCQWPSIRTTSGAAPIIAQGDQTTLNDTTALSGLPPGKYLISVTSDGHKIDGAHFTVAPGGSQLVTVSMHPTPLPLQTIRLQVFNDNAPVDGTYELDVEQGLAGFTAVLNDVLGLVSTDYWGNPLCTTYEHEVSTDPTSPVVFDADGAPVVAADSTGTCISNDLGEIVIPNLGPNRYGAVVTPPAGTSWVQTTTLEGAHDHDIWQAEGEIGLDTERVKGGEPVPYVHFGFVQPRTFAPSVATGEVKGRVVIALPYIGGAGTLGGQDALAIQETGFAGAKSGGPVKSPWVALSDLGDGDQLVSLTRGNPDGSFDITNVPDGSYLMTQWDEDQDLILRSFQVDVVDGGVVNLGNRGLTGWFTHISGTVFIDDNGNGRRDPGEQPVPGFVLTLRERDNSLMDQFTNSVVTDESGVYRINEAYPLSRWLILEGFDTRYQSTGITYKADNDPQPTTLLGAAVDINVLPVIGLGGTIDWGVQPYENGTNGGIVGTVSYDTTRNELDPAYAGAETFQPGIPGVPVHLAVPVPCGTTTPAELCQDGFQVDAATGEYVKGPEIQDPYISETWQPPRGCTARNHRGIPLTDQQALSAFGPPSIDSAKCVESPMMGFQTGAEDVDPATGEFGQQVNGNYGFATSKLNLYAPGDDRNPGDPNGAPGNKALPLYADLAAAGYGEQPLAPQEYIVSVEIPDNPVGGGKMYKVTDEESINVFDGDSYLPQENFPPTAAAVADPPAGATPAPLPTQPPAQAGGIVPPCVGETHVVAVTNQNFIDGGGSPFEGQARHSCVDKLITVRSNQATAPTFFLYTPVPLPTHFWGLTINDLGLQLDKRSVNYGEAQGIAGVPMGLYDWSGKLKDTVYTDFNGFYEALEPSTGTINCPTPAGVCPNMYRFVGNDPGTPDHPNPEYNPRFRTIATNFQAWPGLYTVTDTAPTQVAATVLTPDAAQVNPAMCDLDSARPQLLTVDKPYVRYQENNAARTVVIKGSGFGATQGTGRVALNGNNVSVSNTLSWSNTSITFRVPNSIDGGPATVSVTAANGLSSVNGLTIQMLNNSVQGTGQFGPRLAEVGPGKQFSTIQAALEAAVPTAQRPYWMVIVWPNARTSATPRGEYNENIVLHHRVKVQGVGPGGFDSTGAFVPGSTIDGQSFNPDTDQGAAWLDLVNSLTFSGDPQVPDGAVVTVLDDPARNNNWFSPNFYPALDGFTLTGGSQSNFPGNVNVITGATQTPVGAAGSLTTQGGGIYLHSHVRNFRITDNIIRGNSGSYGGAVRVGTPYLGNNENYGAVIARNQIRDNGGTNLAGAIGLFTGSDNYQVRDNAICGNFSAEYGGAITSYGFQRNQTITGSGNAIAGNTIWFNQSYDEGGAVMIAGQLPADPDVLSEGSGPATISANVIVENLAGDDGGGIRLLQTSGSRITRAIRDDIRIINNTITNNVSAHEGAGIALDDAAFVEVVNTTIARNITTATALTSNGLPAPAGLSSSANSDLLQAKLCGFSNAAPLCATTFSRPVLFNDVFWQNRAGQFVGSGVVGITPGDANNWDMGVAADPTALLTPTNSVLSDGTGVVPSGTNTVGADPLFVSPFEVSVNILASRTFPGFRQSVIVAQLLPPNLSGNYHLAGTNAATAGSAYGRGGRRVQVVWGGTALTYYVYAPTVDIDGQSRPAESSVNGRRDAGSDQIQP